MLKRILNRAVTGFPKREEDNEETFRKRIAIHVLETLPIVEIMEKEGSLINLDSEKQEDEIVKQFLDKIGLNLRNKTGYIQSLFRKDLI